MHSLLYVSTRRLRADMGMQDVDEILAVSRARNVTLDVTGALVATPTHYAQMLEGSEAALGELMESIGRDPRHSDIRLAPIEQKPRRDRDPRFRAGEACRVNPRADADVRLIRTRWPIAAGRSVAARSRHRPSRHPVLTRY